jgi:hypothetical protein
MWVSMLPDFVDPKIQTYFCSLAIGLSGAVRPIANIWLLDGQRHHFNRHYLSSVGDSVDFLIENGLGPLDDIDQTDVTKWVFSQKGVFDGYSDTPAARSLNYFTRLFCKEFKNDELSDLIWALAGIESLLVDAGRSSIGQLKEKLLAIFAPTDNRSWFLSMIDKMYGYRSKMIHGSRHIRSAFRSDDPDIGKRFYEEYDSERFAVGVLVFLLQRVVKLGVSQLHFRTICVSKQYARELQATNDPVTSTKALDLPHHPRRRSEAAD